MKRLGGEVVGTVPRSGKPAEVSEDFPCWVIGLVVVVDGREMIRPIVTLHHHQHDGALQFCAALGEATSQEQIGLMGPMPDCLHPKGHGLEWFIIKRKEAWNG